MSVIRFQHADWSASDMADDAVSTATQAAPSAPLSHYITSISASFSATKSGKLLELKEDTTVLRSWLVYDHIAQEFTHPIKLSPGAAATLVLEASGTGGVIGTVHVLGYTK